MRQSVPQDYPRIPEGEKFAGFLDDRKIAPHVHKIPARELRRIIMDAVKKANRKSSRAILQIPEGTSDRVMRTIYLREGKKLFDYFRKYCGDPASTAFECFGQPYRKVAIEQFRNRTLQKERMNSGWRYQFMSHDCALASRRFRSVSELATAEADFNATVKTIDHSKPLLNIYVSVKNRTNTMGGQDWPKAIAALEAMAKNDQTRHNPYLCVFGIAMERGSRLIKARKGGEVYSVNTEVWLSDYFWLFFSNHSYEEIMRAVLAALIAEGRQVENATIGVQIPSELIDSFGECCRAHALVDADGEFDDPQKLVEMFCRKRAASK